MANFYTEVILSDARVNSVNRVHDPNLLEPTTRQAVENIIADAAVMGITLMMFETYRSQARQLELFNQGASKLRHVGVHHYGLACDLVKSVSGEPSWKGDFSFLAHLAREHRLIWGGD
jgi:LAS superfamily LD-carboxypeptidase LdcB